MTVQEWGPDAPLGRSLQDASDLDLLAAAEVRLDAPAIVPPPTSGSRWPRAARTLARSADRPVLAGLVVLLTAAGFVFGRWNLWAQRSISRFILIGQNFAHPAQLPPGMPLRPAYGYDGQFFYRLAINPVDFSGTAYGITVDHAYRFMRVGYPLLTWLISFGQRAVVPYALVAVNLAALGMLAWLGGHIARQGGRHAAWDLLLAGYFGLVTSLGRDTAEPVAVAFMVAGLLAVRSRRPYLAAALLAFGALTRETVMAAVAAIAVVRLAGITRRRYRPGREDLTWVVPGVVFGLWQVVVHAFIGAYPALADGGRNAGTPLIAPVEAIKYNLMHIDWSTFNAVDTWLAELAVLLLFAGAALCSLRASRAPAHERLALVLFVIEICIVTPTTWSSRSADLRSFVEVFVMAVLVLLGRPRAARWSRGAWLLPAVTLSLLPVLGYIFQYRMSWS